MLLIISDANIVEDIEVSELLVPMLSLNYQFAVPDVLYHEELEDQHAHWLDMGLQTRNLSSKSVERVQSLARTHARTGRNYLFALAMAEFEQCPLLIGNAALRQAAEAERLVVRDIIWLIAEMVREQRITVAAARAALQKMNARGRRLPWDETEETLVTFEIA